MCWILEKRHSTIQGGNSNLPIDLLINIHTHTIKNQKNVYTKIQRVKNVETFNLKSSTDDAPLISKGRLFHSPTILFIKLNLNKLVLERLVKRFGVSILVNIPREPNPRIKGQANMIIDHLIKNNICINLLSSKDNKRTSRSLTKYSSSLLRINFVALLWIDSIRVMLLFV